MTIKKLFCLFVLLVAGHSFILGQEKSDEPKVLTAVAPVFIPFVYNKSGVAEVVVTVGINSDGSVASAKTTSFTLFKDLSIEDAARLWSFEKSAGQDIRTVKLKFVFRIMPKETPVQELTTVFRSPYEIEVRSPIIDSPKTSCPLPDTKGYRPSQNRER